MTDSTDKSSYGAANRELFGAIPTRPAGGVIEDPSTVLFPTATALREAVRARQEDVAIGLGLTQAQQQARNGEALDPARRTSTQSSAMLTAGGLPARAGARSLKR